MVIKALQIAHAGLVAPVQYTILIWGTIYGLILFADIPEYLLSSARLSLLLQAFIPFTENVCARLMSLQTENRRATKVINKLSLTAAQMVGDARARINEIETADLIAKLDDPNLVIIDTPRCPRAAKNWLYSRQLSCAARYD